MTEIDDVLKEVSEQYCKWGEQNHPNGTNCNSRDKFLADVARSETEKHALEGKLTWRDILLEEVMEAFAEDDPQLLYEEVKQVAAVAVTWMKCINRAESSE